MRLTARVQSRSTQHRVEAEDNVDGIGIDTSYNGFVGIAVLVSCFRRFRFFFLSWLRATHPPVTLCSYILLVMEMERTSFFPAP